MLLKALSGANATNGAPVAKATGQITTDVIATYATVLITAIPFADLVDENDYFTLDDGIVDPFDFEFDTLGNGISDAPAPSTGVITCVSKALTADGDYFTMDDGTDTYVFEYDKTGNGVTAGRHAIDLRLCTTAAEVRNKTVQVINGTAIKITAAAGAGSTITLTHDVPGATGNESITENVANAGFTVSGMSGGNRGRVRVNIAGLTSAEEVRDAILAVIQSSPVLDGETLSVTAAATVEVDEILVTATTIGNSGLTGSETVTDADFTVVPDAGVDGILDGDEVLLTDDVRDYRFVFKVTADYEVPAGTFEVDVVGASDEDDVRDALVTAIGGTAIRITASNGGAATVTLTANFAGSKFNKAVQAFTDATSFAVTGMSGATAGLPLRQLADASSWEAIIKSVAGSGTMTVTVGVWCLLLDDGVEDWLYIGLLNNGLAIGETSSNKIARGFPLYDLGIFDEIYFEIAGIGGTSTAVDIFLGARPLNRR